MKNDLFLDTNYSGEAMGWVLQQKQDGNLTVLVYDFREIEPAETRYCTPREETIAAILGLKYFRQYTLDCWRRREMLDNELVI